MGGSGYEEGFALSVDSTGNAIVAGWTGAADFPTTAGAFDRSFNGGWDGFVSGLNADGSLLLFSTLLGGAAVDFVSSVRVDSAGNVYGSGGTNSADFPTTPGAFDRSYNGQGDVFAVRVDPGGGALSYSTFLGGNGGEIGGISIDSVGAAYLTGTTYSSDFPTTPGAFDQSYDGTGDAFAVKMTLVASFSSPSSSVQAIVPYWSTARPISVQASASDPDGTIDRVDLYYRFDGGTGWGSWTLYESDFATPWSWSFSFPDGEGRYEFHTLAFDGTNWEANKIAAEASAGYDATPPASSALPVVPYWHDTPQMTVNASASDALSGIAEVAFRYAHSSDNVTFGPWIPSSSLFASPWSWTFSFPDGEGYYRFHTIAADVAGNIEANKSIAEAIAGYRVPPDYALASPRPAGTATVGLSLPFALSVTVANLGGNANGTSVLAFVNETTPSSPFATFAVPGLAVSGIAGPFAASWISPATPGMYRVLALTDFLDAIQESNESNNAYAWTVTVVPGPMTTLVIGQPNHTASVPYVTSATPLSLSVLDQSGTGIRSTRYQVDALGWADYAGPFTLGTEGEHFLEWYSEDYAANVEATQSAVLRVDDTPPTTSLTIGDPKYLVGGTFVTSTTPLALMAADGGLTPVGLLGTEYQIGGGGWLPYLGPFTLSGEGAHAVEFRSVDLLGNGATASTVTVIVDDSVPSVSLSVGDPKHQGAQLFVAPATELTLSANDEGAIPVGLAIVEHRIGGGSWAAYAGPFHVAAPDGSKAIEYGAADRLGNRADGTLDVVLDDTPPQTAISPPAGPYAPDTVFSLTPMDAGSGVARTEYRVDDGPWLPYAGGFSLPLGNHTIRYRSVDNLGNAEAERILFVTIEEAPPPVPEANWKPLVAAVFAAILALAGWRASRSRWSAARIPRKKRLKVFATVALPFVLAEAATGIASALTGLLSIPPLLGLGTAVDLGILVAGLAVSIYEARRWTPPRAGSPSKSR